MRSIAALLAGLAAAGAGFGAQAQEEVNVYTARHYDTDYTQYEEFTAQTGIEVNFIEGASDQLIERIGQEGRFSPADILITVDAGNLWRAVEADVFQPVRSDVLEARVPAHLRHPDGLWFGLSKRARVIVYSKAAGRPEGLNDYEDLADSRFAGMVCIRSSSNIYNQSLLASLIAHNGAEAAEGWARGVVANFARTPQGGDRTQIEGVAAGECAIGVANSYYLGRYLAGETEEARRVADAVGVIFPNQDDRGAHVNLSGAGVVKHAPNRDNAIRFLEYLTSESAQRVFAEKNNEYSVVAAYPVTSPVAALGAFAEDTLNTAALGENQAEAIRIFDRAGWR